MDVEYLSDDDRRGYHCDTIDINYYNDLEYPEVNRHSDQNIIDLLETKPIQFEETNYYPPLDKHSGKQIVSMINAIDAINKKLNIEVKVKKHRFKERSRKLYGPAYPWVYV